MQQMMPQNTTLAQKIEIVASLCLFPALPVIIFLRKKPGYRFLSPVKLLIIFALLLLLAGFSATAGGATVVILTLFAWAVFITGLVKRNLRWREIKRGVSWHSYSRGVSWLSYVLPLSDSNVKRWVEPAIVLMIGFLLMFPFRWFGLYLIFAAFCLFAFEAYDYERSINQMLDTLDSLVDSEVMSSNVEHYSQPNPTQRPLEETAGIPTGIAPDIQHQIEWRKARKSRPADTVMVAAFTKTPTGNLPGTVI
jgi:hypothetical protein